MTDRVVILQKRLHQNQDEMSGFLKDLNQWEFNMKNKDVAILSEKKTELMLPPVRNSLQEKVKKKKSAENNRKISGYNFTAWDSYDLDKALDQIDEKDSSEYETDEEMEIERIHHLATVIKEQGNDFFHQGLFNEAIRCYTKGMVYDQNNVVLPANRAMAFMKQFKYSEAVVDCTNAITIDPTYVKAYSRRGTARMALCNFLGARQDFQHVLQLIPDNKYAITELDKVEKILFKKSEDHCLNEESSGFVKAVEKPLKHRSKKVLARIPVVEIGSNEDDKVFDINKSFKKEKCVFETDLVVPSVPKNSFQFQTDWKKVHQNSWLWLRYLKEIPPQSYSKLFGQFFDSDILSKILLMIKEHVLPSGVDIYSYLKSLSEVKRFSSNLMLISSADKLVVEELLEHLKLTQDDSTVENLEKIFRDRLN